MPTEVIYPASAYIYTLAYIVVIWAHFRGFFVKGKRVSCSASLLAVLATIPSWAQVISALPFILAPIGSIWVVSQIESYRNVGLALMAESGLAILQVAILAKSFRPPYKGSTLVLSAVAIGGPVLLPLLGFHLGDVRVNKAFIILLSLWLGGLLALLIAYLFAHIRRVR